MGESNRYRKKPVVIEAWRVADLNRAAESDWGALPDAIRDAYERGGWVFGAEVGDAGEDKRSVVNRRRGIYVPTLEGSLFADADDWIIQGVKGEFYPCKPDIFDATYEAVP